jgi:hypothetical protein
MLISYLVMISVQRLTNKTARLALPIAVWLVIVGAGLGRPPILSNGLHALGMGVYPNPAAELVIRCLHLFR